MELAFICLYSFCMSSTESLVTDSQKLMSIFGGWPTFHDAEIVEVKLTAERGITLETEIRVWDMTNEVDEKGYYVLKHETLVRLRFDDVQDLKLSDFYSQNVILELTIKQTANPRLKVSFFPSVGLDAEFMCAKISVIDAKLVG